MPFRFVFETLLHLRKSLEHQHELRLRAANQHVLRPRHLVAQFDAAREELQLRRDHEIRSGTTAAELCFAIDRDNEIAAQRIAAEQLCDRMQKLRDQQRQLLQDARREREILESLREQQLQSFQKKALRRQQRWLDDLFLVRREYRNRS